MGKGRPVLYSPDLQRSQIHYGIMNFSGRKSFKGRKSSSRIQVHGIRHVQPGAGDWRNKRVTIKLQLRHDPRGETKVREI
jgi:hypothetical protein